MSNAKAWEIERKQILTSINANGKLKEIYENAIATGYSNEFQNIITSCPHNEGEAEKAWLLGYHTGIRKAREEMD